MFVFAIMLGVVATALSNVVTEDLSNRQLMKTLEETDAHDFFGGKTPNETVDLLRAALTKGDLDLASKYFLRDKQGQMRIKFGKANDNNVISAFIQLLNLKRKDHMITPEIHQITIPVDKSQFVIDLVLNPSTHIWKLDAF